MRLPLKKRLWRARIALIAFAIIVNIATWIPALFPHSIFGEIVFGGFSQVCHQLPERSFTFAGEPIAICHRCSGIYLGGLIGVLMFGLLLNIKKRFSLDGRLMMAVALAPAGVDWLLTFFGIWENTTFSQTVTGGLIGLAGGYLLWEAVRDGLRVKKEPIHED